MGRVRYARSLRDLERDAFVEAKRPPDSVRAFRCRYETDAEAAQAVVPRPLEACVGSEVGVSFVSVSTPTTAGMTIETRWLRFGVCVDYDDHPGNYLITTPTTSQVAATASRERFGLPAKSATIEFDRADGDVSASVERKGTRYLVASGRFVEDLGPREEVEFGYAFKAFPSCLPGKDFDQDPQLVRLEWRSAFDRVWRLEGRLELRDSPFDPVFDLPIRRIIGAEYAEGSSVESGRVLRPVPGAWLLPFLHQRDDAPEIEGVEV